MGSYELNIEASRYKRDKAYKFKSWSDGGTRAYTITTPSSATTYKAKYKKR